MKPYIGNIRRYELIYKILLQVWLAAGTPGFVAPKEHAREMAREFSSRGIPSVAVFSDANWGIYRKT